MPLVAFNFKTYKKIVILFYNCDSVIITKPTYEGSFTTKYHG